MKILAINGTYQPKGTTTRHTDRALEGAAAQGAKTEHVLLVEKEIQFCANCLTCYKDLTSTIAPCSIEDDVRGILESIQEADGVILASPVHCGFTTALMFAFLERACFPLATPTGSMLGYPACPEPRLTDKPRAVATIVSAGGTPPELRQYCDLATPFLAEAGALLANGLPMGDLYAAAYFSKEMRDEDWPRSFLLRELTEDQLQEAYDLGVKMARAIKAGAVKPFDAAYFEQAWGVAQTDGEAPGRAA